MAPRRFFTSLSRAERHLEAGILPLNHAREGRSALHCRSAIPCTAIRSSAGQSAATRQAKVYPRFTLWPSAEPDRIPKLCFHQLRDLDGHASYGDPHAATPHKHGFNITDREREREARVLYLAWMLEHLRGDGDGKPPTNQRRYNAVDSRLRDDRDGNPPNKAKLRLKPVRRPIPLKGRVGPATMTFKQAATSARKSSVVAETARPPLIVVRNAVGIGSASIVRRPGETKERGCRSRGTKPVATHARLAEGGTAETGPRRARVSPTRGTAASEKAAEVLAACALNTPTALGEDNVRAGSRPRGPAEEALCGAERRAGHDPRIRRRGRVTRRTGSPRTGRCRSCLRARRRSCRRR